MMREVSQGGEGMGRGEGEEEEDRSCQMMATASGEEGSQRRREMGWGGKRRGPTWSAPHGGKGWKIMSFLFWATVLYVLSAGTSCAFQPLEKYSTEVQSAMVVEVKDMPVSPGEESDVDDDYSCSYEELIDPESTTNCQYKRTFLSTMQSELTSGGILTNPIHGRFSMASIGMHAIDTFGLVYYTFIPNARSGNATIAASDTKMVGSIRKVDMRTGTQLTFNLDDSDIDRQFPYTPVAMQWDSISKHLMILVNDYEDDGSGFLTLVAMNSTTGELYGGVTETGERRSADEYGDNTFISFCAACAGSPNAMSGGLIPELPYDYTAVAYGGLTIDLVTQSVFALLWNPDIGPTSRKLFAISRPRDVMAAGNVASIDWTKYRCYDWPEELNMISRLEHLPQDTELQAQGLTNVYVPTGKPSSLLALASLREEEGICSRKACGAVLNAQEYRAWQETRISDEYEAVTLINGRPYCKCTSAIVRLNVNLEGDSAGLFKTGEYSMAMTNIEWNTMDPYTVLRVIDGKGLEDNYSDVAAAGSSFEAMLSSLRASAPDKPAEFYAVSYSNVTDKYGIFGVGIQGQSVSGEVCIENSTCLEPPNIAILGNVTRNDPPVYLQHDKFYSKAAESSLALVSDLPTVAVRSFIDDVAGVEFGSQVCSQSPISCASCQILTTEIEIDGVTTTFADYFAEIGECPVPCDTYSCSRNECFLFTGNHCGLTVQSGNEIEFNVKAMNTFGYPSKSTNDNFTVTVTGSGFDALDNPANMPTGDITLGPVFRDMGESGLRVGGYDENIQGSYEELAGINYPNFHDVSKELNGDIVSGCQDGSGGNKCRRYLVRPAYTGERGVYSSKLSLDKAGLYTIVVTNRRDLTYENPYPELGPQNNPYLETYWYDSTLEPVLGAPILGAPYNLTVVPGPSSSLTMQPSGEGLSKANVGVVSEFIIQTRDNFVNVRFNPSGQTIAVRLVGAGDVITCDSNTQTVTSETSAWCAVVYDTSGAYKVSYFITSRSTADNEYSLSITVANINIYRRDTGGTTWNIVVGQGSTDGAMSFTMKSPGDPDGRSDAEAGAESIFLVQARDRFGNLQETSEPDDAPEFAVRLTDSANNTITTTGYQTRRRLADISDGIPLISIEDSGDGKYVVRYTPFIKGPMKVEALYGDVQLGASPDQKIPPFTVDVRSGPPNSEYFLAYGEGLTEFTAQEVSSSGGGIPFHIQLRDTGGNNITSPLSSEIDGVWNSRSGMLELIVSDDFTSCDVSDCLVTTREIEGERYIEIPNQELGQYSGGIVAADFQAGHIGRGVVEVKYGTPLAGWYDVKVKLPQFDKELGIYVTSQFVDILGSPFRVKVNPAAFSGAFTEVLFVKDSTTLHSSHSHITHEFVSTTGDSALPQSGNSFSMSAEAGRASTFIIQRRDIFGNLLDDEAVEEPLVIIFGEKESETYYIGSNATSTEPAVEYIGTGMYEVTYHPISTGMLDIKIEIDGQDVFKMKKRENNGIVEPYVTEERYRIEVTPQGIAASGSTANGKGLQGGTLDEELFFTIYARDELGNIQETSTSTEASFFRLGVRYCGTSAEHRSNPNTIEVSCQFKPIIYYSDDFRPSMTAALQNGLYESSYTLGALGVYKLEIEYKFEALTGGEEAGERSLDSIFIKIRESAEFPSAGATQLVPLNPGDSLYSRGVAGEHQKLRIRAYDLDGIAVERLDGMSDAVGPLSVATQNVILRHTSGVQLSATSVTHDVSNFGSYIIEFGTGIVTLSGDYQLDISVSTFVNPTVSAISDNNRVVSIYSADADSEETVVALPGVTSLSQVDTIANTTLSFGIRSHDIYGNEVMYKSLAKADSYSLLSVSTTGGVVEEQQYTFRTETQVESLPSGLQYLSIDYVQDVIITRAGDYDFYFKLNGLSELTNRDVFGLDSNGLYHLPIVVRPGPRYVPKCVAFLTQSEYTIEKSVSLKISEYDYFDNERTIDSSDVFNVVVYTNEGSSESLQYTPPTIGTDSHELNFLAGFRSGQSVYKSGDHYFNITMGGEEIMNNGLSITVLPGELDLSKTKLFGRGYWYDKISEGSPGTARVGVEEVFHLLGRDRFNNTITTGGDSFEISLIQVDENSEGRPMTGTVTDNNNGTYTLRYLPMTQGNYIIQTSQSGQVIDPSRYFYSTCEFLPCNDYKLFEDSDSDRIQLLSSGPEVVVLPGPLSAYYTFARGGSIGRSGATIVEDASVPLDFSIVALDVANGDKIDSDDDKELMATLEFLRDNRNLTRDPSTDRATYTATGTGSYTLPVTLVRDTESPNVFYPENPTRDAPDTAGYYTLWLNVTTYLVGDSGDRTFNSTQVIGNGEMQGPFNIYIKAAESVGSKSGLETGGGDQTRRRLLAHTAPTVVDARAGESLEFNLVLRDAKSNPQEFDNLRRLDYVDVSIGEEAFVGHSTCEWDPVAMPYAISNTSADCTPLHIGTLTGANATYDVPSPSDGRGFALYFRNNYEVGSFTLRFKVDGQLPALQSNFYKVILKLNSEDIGGTPLALRVLPGPTVGFTSMIEESIHHRSMFVNETYTYALYANDAYGNRQNNLDEAGNFLVTMSVEVPSLLGGDQMVEIGCTQNSGCSDCSSCSYPIDVAPGIEEGTYLMSFKTLRSSSILESGNYTMTVRYCDKSDPTYCSPVDNIINTHAVPQTGGIHQPFSLRIKPSETHVPSSTIEGHVLEAGGLVGRETSFYIVSRDKFGNIVHGGGDEYYVHIYQPNNSGRLQLIGSIPEDNGDGTYVARFVPQIEGPHSVIIISGAQHVIGSPMTLSFRSNDGALEPRESRIVSATGDNLSAVTVNVGTQHVVLVQAYACFGENPSDCVPKNSGGNNVRATITGPSSTQAVNLMVIDGASYIGAISGLVPGRYGIPLTTDVISTSGIFTLQIEAQGPNGWETIRNHAITVNAISGEVDFQMSSVVTLDHNSWKAGNVLSIEVRLRDSYGSLITSTNEKNSLLSRLPIQVELSSSVAAEFSEVYIGCSAHELADNLPLNSYVVCRIHGEYSVKFRVEHVSQITASISLDGHTFSGSESSFDIQPNNVYMPNCIISKANTFVDAGMMATVEIQLRDRYGNSLRSSPTNLDFLEVTAELLDPFNIPAEDGVGDNPLAVIGDVAPQLIFQGVDSAFGESSWRFQQSRLKIKLVVSVIDKRDGRILVGIESGRAGIGMFTVTGRDSTTGLDENVCVTGDAKALCDEHATSYTTGHFIYFYELAPSADTSIAYSDNKGLESTIAGQGETIGLLVHDPYRNAITYDGYLFTALLENVETGQKLTGTVSFDPTTDIPPYYSIRYVARQAGTYSLSITRNGKHLSGRFLSNTLGEIYRVSPFILQVAPGPASALTSFITHETLPTPQFDYFGQEYRPLVAEAGEVTGFTITTFDSYGNKINVGGEKPKADIDSTTEILVIDNDDGTYSGNYTLQYAGDYEFRVELNKEQVTSPNIAYDYFFDSFYLTVRGGATAPLYTKVQGLSLDASLVGAEGFLLVATYDVYGNQRSTGGDNITMEIPESNAVIDVEDLNNGFYVLSYVIETADTYELTISVNNVPAFVKPDLLVMPDIVDEISIVNFTQGSQTAGQNNSLMITPLDQFGNGVYEAAYPLSDSDLVVEVYGERGGRIAPEIVNFDTTITTFECPYFLGFRCYGIDFVSPIAGTSYASIQIGDVILRGSPFAFVVIPALTGVTGAPLGHPNRCIAEGSDSCTTVEGRVFNSGLTDSSAKNSFTILVADIYGNRKDSTGEDFRVVVTMPDGRKFSNLGVDWNTDSASLPTVQLSETKGEDDLCDSRKCYDSYEVSIPFAYPGEHTIDVSFHSASDATYGLEDIGSSVTETSLSSVVYDPSAIPADLNPVVAAKSTVSGEGLIVGVAGETSKLIIYSKRDVTTFNTTVDAWSGGADVQVDIFDSNSTIVEGVVVADNNDGTYTVRFDPTRSGYHTIEVKINNETLSHGLSPRIYGGDIFAGKVTARSLMSAESLVIGTRIMHEIEPKDQFGNFVEKKPWSTARGTFDFSMTCDPPLSSSQQAEVDRSIIVSNLDDGLIRMSYLPTLVGNWKIHSFYNGEEISSSPLEYAIRAGDISAAETKVFGLSQVNTTSSEIVTVDELFENVEAAKQFQLLVQGYDSYGNKLSDPDACTKVAMTHIRQENSAQGMSLAFADGNNECVLNVTLASTGTYNFMITIDGILWSEDVESSESFTYAVTKTVTDPLQCVISNEAATTLATADQATSFQLQMIDNSGLAKVVGGDLVEASIEPKFSQNSMGKALFAQAVDVTYTELGQYSLQYQLQDIGNYSLSVTVNKQPISGSSFDLVCGPQFPPLQGDFLLSTTGTRLSVSFYDKNGLAMATNRADTRGMTPCGDVLSEDSAALLGIDPQCNFVTPYDLTVFLGSSATILPNDQISYLSGKIFGKDLNTKSVSGSSKVIPPQRVPSPRLVVKAPQFIGICDDFVLDSSGSYGSAGRALNFTYGMYPNVPNERILSAQLDAATRAINVDTVTIDTNLIEPQVPYTFTIRAKNFLGQSAFVSHTITRQLYAIPIVEIEGDPVLRVARAKHLFIPASVRVPDSDDPRCALPTSEIEYSWSFDLERTTGVFPLDETTKHSRILHIPPNTLIAGETYYINVNATVAGHPNLYGTATAVVEVQYTATNAVIEAPTVIVEDQPFLLSGEKSIDEDDPNPENPQEPFGQFEFYWYCEKVSDGTECFDDSLGLLLQDPYQKELSIPANTFASGSYRFLVYVYKEPLFGPDGFIDGRVKAIEHRFDVVPALGAGMIETVPMIRISALVKSVFNSNVANRITSNLINPGLKPVTNYYWEVLEGDLDLDAYPANLNTPRTSFNLAIKENVLSAGAIYRLKLTATNIQTNQTASDEVSFSVNGPPNSGTFEISPTVGYASETVFSLTSSKWEDDSGEPPSYEYRYVDPSSGDEVPLISMTRMTEAQTTVPPVSLNISQHEVEIVAYIADYDGGKTRAAQNITVYPPQVEDSVAEILYDGALFNFTGAPAFNDKLIERTYAIANGTKNVALLFNLASSVLYIREASERERAGIVMPILLPGSEPDARMRDEMERESRISDVLNSQLIAVLVDLSSALKSVYNPIEALDSYAPVLRQAVAALVEGMESLGDMALESITSLCKDTLNDGVGPVATQALLDALGMLSELSQASAGSLDSVRHSLLSAGNTDYSSPEHLESHDREVSDTLRMDVASLTTGALTGFVDSQDSLVVVSNSISLSATRTSSVGGTFSVFGHTPPDEVDSNSTVVDVPQNMTGGVSNYDVVLVTRRNNPFSYSRDTTNIQSDVTEFDLKEEGAVNATDVSGLTTPITITIPLGPPGGSSCRVTNAGCRFYDETLQAWSTEGMREKRRTEHFVECETVHLSSFGLSSDDVVPDFKLVNPVDAADLFSNINADNMIAFIVVGFLFFMYAIANFLGYKIDVRDRAKEKIATRIRSIDSRLRRARSVGTTLKGNEIAEKNELESQLDGGGLLDKMSEAIKKNHIVANILFVKPDDAYTRPQRLTVLLAVVLGNIAVAAIFFNAEPGNIMLKVIIGVVTALLLMPIKIVFKLLFKASVGVKRRKKGMRNRNATKQIRAARLARAQKLRELSRRSLRTDAGVKLETDPVSPKVLSSQIENESFDDLHINATDSLVATSVAEKMGSVPLPHGQDSAMEGTIPPPAPGDAKRRPRRKPTRTRLAGDSSGSPFSPPQIPAGIPAGVLGTEMPSPPPLNRAPTRPRRKRSAVAPAGSSPTQLSPPPPPQPQGGKSSRPGRPRGRSKMLAVVAATAIANPPPPPPGSSAAARPRRRRNMQAVSGGSGGGLPSPPSPLPAPAGSSAFEVPKSAIRDLVKSQIDGKTYVDDRLKVKLEEKYVPEAIVNIVRKIQVAWRFRHAVQKKKRERAATRIQAVWRGYVSRKKKEKTAEAEERDTMTAKPAALWWVAAHNSSVVTTAATASNADIEHQWREEEETNDATTEKLESKIRKRRKTKRSKKKAKKKKMKGLPRWFIYVTYMLCFGFIAFAALMICLYGVTFEPSVGRAWLLSSILSVMVEFLLQDPLRVCFLGGLSSKMSSRSRLSSLKTKYVSELDKEKEKRTRERDALAELENM